MLRRNFVFFDWSIPGDSSGVGEPSAEEISANVVNGMAGKDRAIVKFRDSVGIPSGTDRICRLRSTGSLFLRPEAHQPQQLFHGLSHIFSVSAWRYCDRRRCHLLR